LFQAKARRAALVAAWLGIAGVVPAGAADIAIGAKASTLGFGFDLTGRVADSLNVRAGFHPLPTFTRTGTDGDIEYEYKIQLLSAAAGLDFHPGGGGFHLSGGFVLNRNEVSASASPASSYEIGGTRYTGAQVGTLGGEIKFKELAPYLGLGFGNAVAAGKKIGISLDLGVVFAGSPQLELNATGPIAGDPGFRADLDEEEADVEDSLSSFKLYPILSLAITYKF
jgi:hypothetical protein